MREGAFSFLQGSLEPEGASLLGATSSSALLRTGLDGAVVGMIMGGNTLQI